MPPAAPSLDSTAYWFTLIPRTSLTSGSVMGIIGWIVLGLGAGLAASMLIPGRRQQGLILTCLIGIVGALGGGWAATKIFHIHNTLHSFFNASTWLTAVAGAAVLLLAHQLAKRQSGGSRTRRRYAHP